MAELLNGLFQTQITWLLSPMGLGIAVATGFLIGSGVLGRIVLLVERELQIRSDRRRRSEAEAPGALRRTA